MRKWPRDMNIYVKFGGLQKHFDVPYLVGQVLEDAGALKHDHLSSLDPYIQLRRFTVRLSSIRTAAIFPWPLSRVRSSRCQQSEP